MSLHDDARKLGAIVAIGAREAASQRAELIGRALFYMVLLLVFSRIWGAVLAQSDGHGFTVAQMLWYLAITEWVILSLPELHLRIERDVRSGDIAYQLARPVSYYGSRFAEGLGTMLVRLGLLGVCGFFGAWLLAGSLPAEPWPLLAAIPTGLVAALLGLSFLGAIGLSSIWLQEVQPLYWVWQKFAFILGGLILPLDIYPEWLQRFAEWTPFHAMLYGAGRWTLAFDSSVFALQLLVICGWLLVVSLVCAWVLRRGLARLDVNGG